MPELGALPGDVAPGQVERRSVARRADDALTDAAFEALPRFWLGQAVLAAGFVACARLGPPVPGGLLGGLSGGLSGGQSGGPGASWLSFLAHLTHAANAVQPQASGSSTLLVGLLTTAGVLMLASMLLALGYHRARLRLGDVHKALRIKRHWRLALSTLLGCVVLLPAGLGLWSDPPTATATQGLLMASSLVQLAQLALVLATLPMLAGLATATSAGLLLPALAWLAQPQAGSAGLAVLLCVPALAGAWQARVAARRWVSDAEQRLSDRDRCIALEAERDAARRSDDDKRRFVAAASHDLRQPMHALGLFVATLERQLAGAPEEPLVRNMMRAIEVLDRSFTAMLDISRLDAGTVQPRMQSFPLRDLFRRLHMHFAGQAEVDGLALRFSPGGKSVTSDPQLLERVLGNLLQNALRYTRSGGVVVLARSRVDRLNIEVWDSGCGIAAPDLPRVFDEFYRGQPPEQHSSADAAQGLGMGLAIVRRLVALLGHTLDVQSVPGRGTLFRIGITHTPFADIEAQTAGADTIPAPAFSAHAVLVIDDEPAIREGLQLLLETWGFVAEAAADVAQARALAARMGDELDLVISDLHLMHGEDGLQAIAAVRAACGRPVPAMLVTGDTSPAEIRRATASGNMVLFKPLQPSKLFSVLRTLVD